MLYPVGHVITGVVIPKNFLTLMHNSWKKTNKLLIRTIIITTVLVQTAQLLSLRPTILLFIVTALAGLWMKRKHLPLIVGQVKVLISVIFGTALLFGFLLWFIYGNLGAPLILILGTVVVVILSLGHYDINEKIRPEDELPASSLLVAEEALPIEEQQKCPICETTITRTAKRCPWCGTSF